MFVILLYKNHFKKNPQAISQISYVLNKMRVHLQHLLSKQVCFPGDLRGDVTVHCKRGYRPHVGKRKLPQFQQTLYTRLFFTAAARAMCLKASKEEHWCNAYAASHNRLRETNEYVGAALDLLPVLWGVGLFGWPWSTLSQQECMEITHGEKGKHLFGTTVTRETGFRNHLLL